MTVHANVTPKPKQSLLPILIVLFLVSYGLMAMLVVEQGRTIDSQRFLIKELFRDSTELTGMKVGVIQKQRAQAQAEANANSQAKAPASQATPRDNAKRFSCSVTHSCRSNPRAATSSQGRTLVLG